MIEALIYLLIVLLVAVVVWYIVKLVAATFGLPAVAVQVAGAIIALIFLLYALKVLRISFP
jgi:hypothetical protein